MDPLHRRADDLNAFIDASLERGSGPVDQPDYVGTETAQLVQDLRDLAASTLPREGFVDALAVDLGLTSMTSVGQRVQKGLSRFNAYFWSRRRRSLVAASLVGLLFLAVGLWIAGPVQAQLHRVNCLVPGLGIRECGPTSLMAQRPISVSRDGATLTISTLLSSGGQTVLGLKISGLTTAIDDSSANLLSLQLRDMTGKQYAPKGIRAQWIEPNDPHTIVALGTFAALDSGVRLADITVDGPPPLHSWSVQVPVSTLQDWGLPVAQPATASKMLHGITVSVTSVVTTKDATMIQLAAAASPPDGVHDLANHFPQVRPLILHDDHGRQYREQHFQPTIGHFDQGFTDDVLFPALASDVHSVDLNVPFVTVQRAAQATITVPIANQTASGAIPIADTYRLGNHPFQITGARIVPDPCADCHPELPANTRWLELELNLGDWHAGERLLAPGHVRVAGWGAGSAISFFPEYSQDIGQWTRLTVPLPPQAGDEASITLDGALVAIQGPWQFHIPIQPK